MKPARSSASGGMSSASCSAQSRRPRRCAVIRITREAMLNGATPMFSRRVSVVGASLVCSVESTRWPVCAALIGDVGGLEVADLAHHDDVRVLAQERAQRRGEREPGLVVDVHLVDARQVDFRPGPRRSRC